MASGDTLLILSPLGAQFPTSSYATLDFRNNIPVLDYDAAGTESAFWVVNLPRHYGGGGLTAKIDFMASTATSGNVVWGIDYERCTTDLDADSFATQNTVIEACSATSGIIASASIAHTSGAQIDNMAAGETIRVRVQRLGGNASDTMAGDAELVTLEVRET
jgi:hypothetical protein